MFVSSSLVLDRCVLPRAHVRTPGTDASLEAPPGPARGAGRARRVVVVEDDDINRRGIAGLLAECDGIGLVAALTHQEAMRWEGCWEEVDMVLVDAADERAQGDQFPGVAVVQLVRSRRTPHQTLVVVITGHFFDDALRRRLREARADFLYHRTELAERQALYDIVLHPESHRRIPDPDNPEAELRYGVTDATRVNRAVAYALEHRLGEALEQRSGQRTRAWLHLRRRFNEEARLTAMTSDGLLPDRPQDLPSLPQIARFLAWATQVKAHTTSPGDRTRGGERRGG
jgi:CheY-like chemotaxis protein